MRSVVEWVCVRVCVCFLPPVFMATFLYNSVSNAVCYCKYLGNFYLQWFLLSSKH